MNDPVVEAYLGALAMMSQTGPRDLLAAAGFVLNDPSSQLTEHTLRSYLNRQDPNDELSMELRLRLGKWDYAESQNPWTNGSVPNTDERRALINQCLNINTKTTQLLLDMFPVASGDEPVVIPADNWEPWYDDDFRRQRSFYWENYSRYLLENRRWGERAIVSLDIATSRVVERLSNPSRTEPYQSKGLVVGHVQSGKTANFTGVVAKAIDAGYRLIVVLTGTTDLLRSQTQRRLDMELVGQENILRGIRSNDHEALESVDYYGDDPDWPKFVRYGLRPSEIGRPDIHRLTTRDFDYKSLRQGIAALDFERRERGKPFYHTDNLVASDTRLVVVKKNGPILRRLVGDLNKITARLSEIPALIIDDESDEASVNTSNPKNWADGEVERTAINALLSQLLAMLPRAQYVGYTATPFANVFIDPSDTENIFPKDFLISLQRPPGYMGASEFHDLDYEIPLDERTYSNSREKAHVRSILTDDAEGVDATLQSALDSYVLTGAVKLYRENEGVGSFRHHTMLVHEAMKREVHREQARHIADLWDRSGYRSPACMLRLKALYQDDILQVARALPEGGPAPDFDGLRPFIGQAVNRISQGRSPVVVVNSDKIEGEALDFDRNDVWRILVGGNKLARGFTIEGLTISWYRRSARNAATLMQMGRWFGFRGGYHDLVRLYTTAELYESFEAICRDEEFFRSELAQYAVLIDGRPQVTPAKIPPLVASHREALRPAAPNKMYNAVLVERRTRNKEPTGYPAIAARKDLAANTRAFVPLLQQAVANPPVDVDHAGRRFRAYESEASHAAVLAVLSRLRWDNPDCFSADLAWLRTLQPEDLRSWLIVLPQLKRDPFQVRIEGLGPFSLHPRQAAEGYVRVKTTVDDRNAIEAEVRTPGSRRGGMLIYPMIPGSMDAPKDGRPIDPGAVVMAFRLMLPESTAPVDQRLVKFATRDSSRPDKPIIDWDDNLQEPVHLATGGDA